MTESKMEPPVAARGATAQQRAAEEGQGFSHRPVFHRTVDPSKCHTVFDCHRSITEHFRGESTDQSRLAEKNYFLDTAHLIFDYHERSTRTGVCDEPTKVIAPVRPRGRPRKKRKKDAGRLLNFLRKVRAKEGGGGGEAGGVEPGRGGVEPGGGKAGATKRKVAGLAEIVERYNTLVNPICTLSTTHTRPDPFEACASCGAEGCCVLKESDSTIQCTNCGACTYSPVLQSRPSFRMSSRTARPTLTLYKRINHFNDWISQFQAKESVSVPDKVCGAITAELAKRGPNWRSRKITTTGLRRVLRKLGYNKYYEHIPRIIHRLQGTPAPSISRETEEKLRTMFRMVQEPFMRHSPPSRRNFLQYSYVLNKFVGILGMHGLKESFPLLKSRVKLYQQDTIWKKICKDLGFPFEPSL